MTDEVKKILAELGFQDKLTSCVANRDPGSSVFLLFKTAQDRIEAERLWRTKAPAYGE